MSVLKFDSVSKVFRSSLIGRHMYTLGPVSFEVEQGEVFGYLGPNGAGKTTTVKLALGLLRASAGSVTCFGKPSTSAGIKGRIGFLPEQPYFYQHLSAVELLEFYGGVCGMKKKPLRRRAEELLHATGLWESRDTTLSKFSKGMLQRIGLAQALINDPDIIILDEPLSGLDPVGRREIRDLILQQKMQGKTVFFSSHILHDVEIICDRVGILSQGKILRIATISEVRLGSTRCVEIQLDGLEMEKAAVLGLGEVAKHGDKTVISLTPDADVSRAVGVLLASGATISAVIPHRQTLEDYFMSQVQSPVCQPEEEKSRTQKALQTTG
ncbi:MAG: ABC transporter ATP-binding protein [Candidatus Eisenbacteria bacterium]